MRPTAASIAGLATLLPFLVIAQSSSCGPAPTNDIRPSIASGYTYQVVATGLAKPRGLVLDGEGNLLVVEADRGVISAHTLQEENGCVSISRSSVVTDALGVSASAATTSQSPLLTFDVAQPWHRALGGRQNSLWLLRDQFIFLDLRCCHTICF